MNSFQRDVLYWGARPPSPPDTCEFTENVWLHRRFVLFPKKCVSGKYIWLKFAYKEITKTWYFGWKYTTKWYSEIEQTKRILQQ